MSDETTAKAREAPTPDVEMVSAKRLQRLVITLGLALLVSVVAASYWFYRSQAKFTAAEASIKELSDRADKAKSTNSAGLKMLRHHLVRDYVPRLREGRLIVALVLPNFPGDMKTKLQTEHPEWQVVVADGTDTLAFTPRKAQRIVASWWVPWSHIGYIRHHHDIHVTHEGDTVQMTAIAFHNYDPNPGEQETKNPFTIELHALYVEEASEGSDIGE